MVDLLAMARRLADVSEGVACAGTSLESRTCAVRGKAFLFVSATTVRLKLEASAGEAKRLGGDVGANGWVKLAVDSLPPAAVLRRWLAESHGLLGGGKATTEPPSRASRGGARRTTRKKP